MRNRLAILLLLGVSLVFALLFGRQVYLSRGLSRAHFEQKKLRVLTYSTFVGATGPGGLILDQFKKTHDCELEVVTTHDAGLLLERMRVDQAGFDVVIGLDQFMLEDARAKASWRSVDVAREEWNETAQVLKDPNFVAFDWSPLTFIYRQGEVEPPHGLTDLLEARFKGKIALQDPRDSSPGRQFYAWIEMLKGPATAAFLKKLQPNVQSVSPSWAFSYGLFAKHQATLVFSYVTSLAFHWGTEHDRAYRAVAFPEGHPVQSEFAGVPTACHECALAEDFVRGLAEPGAQSLIMQKNFMFPVRKGLEKGTVFAELPTLKTLAIPTSKGQDLSDWDKVFHH